MAHVSSGTAHVKSSAPVPQQATAHATLIEPREVDEFADICCEDEKARLDLFSSELRSEPGARGYIIFYGGQRYASCAYSGSDNTAKRPRHGEAEARAARLKPYLVHQREHSPEQITVINGGYRESWMAELWIVPEGAKHPTPTPTLSRINIKYRKGRVTKREFQSQCEEG